MPRIAPAAAPYEPQIAEALERIMPPGLEPLVLFRTMARNPRVFAKMFAGGLLDKGALGLRQREIVIDRTTARLGCEYEWGVHIALFAERVKLDATQVDGDAAWSDARAHFDEAQIIEVIALVGYYHTITFLCRGLELPLEPYGARFPA
ncbi:MAG: carboxymuconolactone decarboxylase family protein [Alphaproteobacteria bacterium]|nr:carboxymuconolactone decarboxylase family protein [Alphaproteobacteria bacterium]